MKARGTEPQLKAGELSQLRALRERVRKDRDAYDLVFAIERDQLAFNEVRRADRALGIIDRAIEKREER